MSVSFAQSTFVVFFSEFDPGRDDDATPTRVICAHCLGEDADEQLGRGLDLAKRHGQVDFDRVRGEWFVPGGAP